MQLARVVEAARVVQIAAHLPRALDARPIEAVAAEFTVRWRARAAARGVATEALQPRELWAD